jgi:hypothetical protein
MKLNQIFQKPVNRTIEGVIKADDETSLRVEIEEYVLTTEVASRLDAFLDAYNNSKTANGAWISGFFGSGKSHLLKILALLLENRIIDGTPALDLFLPKCAGNAILAANLKKAAAVPSRSILFNIDQKADVISKTQVDALLAVFVKVFDEMCGYYGKQGYIAKFERDLDQRGLYEAFKRAFQQHAAFSWETGREQALLEAENISLAYAETTGSSVESGQGILEKYRTDYKVSIEDFAVEVNQYIERQGPGFRLNFFVDEVGQYIAGNVKLMTNLQTIAESLATKCRGRAWIVVTSQQEMKDVIGEMTAQQGNDFSKIMGRFSTRMILTSQNVAVVIQKRLLAKNSTGIPLLESLYDQQVNNFGTLFDFSDGSRTYRSFRKQEDFIDSYPFIPYQFELFQAAIQGLSLHNAFEGRHSSVGERSMLAVFQQVAVHIANHDIGQLATFDLMFEGIRTALKSQFQQSIITAENNLNNAFAVRILKALFLVKYVKEFKPTVHNVCVLMNDRFGVDISQLRKNVEEALNLLELQTYVQRNGDVYEYLTNEEKDIEEEIKNTEVDSDAVSAEMVKVLFDQVIRERKIHFDETNHDFMYTRKLDDQISGREYELTIHIISPFHEHYENLETLKMHSVGRSELLVVLPAENRFMQDLLMYKRTEKFIQQNLTTTQQDTIKRILTDRSFQNRERYKQIETRGKDMLSEARLFVSGDALENGSAEPLTRIVRGFHELIKRTYPNLKMLKGIQYSENDIEQYLRPTEGVLTGIDLTSLNEAEQEILAHIQSNRNVGTRTTFKLLVERFEKRPYGWPLPAIQCNLAMLYAHGKVEVLADGSLLEGPDLARSLRNTQKFGNLIVEGLIGTPPEIIRKLKVFFEDFFDRSPQSTEARDLGKETAAALQERLEKLSELARNYTLYPFLSELNGPLAALKEVVGKPYTFYFEEFQSQINSLLEMKNDTIAPILSFWNGTQKGLYDEARKFHQEQYPNFDYLEGEESRQLKDALADTGIFRGGRMVQTRTLVETLKGRLVQKIQQEKRLPLQPLQTSAASCRPCRNLNRSHRSSRAGFWRRSRNTSSSLSIKP